MLVTSTTKTYADITMFGDIALTLLKKMGHSANVPGAILAADIPAAKEVSAICPILLTKKSWCYWQAPA
jgi:hypothetical protein